MQWASSAVAGSDFGDVLDRALSAVAGRLGPAAPGAAVADLVFLFTSDAWRDEAEEAPARVAEALPGALLVGCTAGGVIGGGAEYEHVPALSVLAGRLPGAGLHLFAARQEDFPDADAPPGAWHAFAGVSPADAPSFVLLADPTTVDASALVEGLDYAYPGATKVGGLASGAERAGEQRLFYGDRVLRGGAVGLALMGDVDLTPAVAQGCRPLGPPLRVTACADHLLIQVEDRPVLDALAAVLEEASPRDRELARTSLFVGFETDPFGGEGAHPWLIRNLLGVDRETRGLVVGEALRPGRRLRFHVRDRVTSAEDLRDTLAAAGRRQGPAPVGALLFSCLGRGAHLYGTPHHDSRAFDRQFVGVPLGGFFCHGEIGPVGGTTHLHGYTSSFGLIRPKSGA
jgi:small ligand-binding sensory domain FIST